MAKAIKYWYGTDTYGYSVEVAQREDGVFFCRRGYSNGRYGVSKTKWTFYKPNFEESTVNAYSGELTHHPEKPVMTYGFQRLAELNSDLEIKIRLPNQ